MKDIACCILRTMLIFLNKILKVALCLMEFSNFSQKGKSYTQDYGLRKGKGC